MTRSKQLLGCAGELYRYPQLWTTLWRKFRPEKEKAEALTHPGCPFELTPLAE
jgi:hypothetical protein